MKDHQIGGAITAVVGLTSVALVVMGLIGAVRASALATGGSCSATQSAWLQARSTLSETQAQASNLLTIVLSDQTYATSEQGASLVSGVQTALGTAAELPDGVASCVTSDDASGIKASADDLTAQTTAIEAAAQALNKDFAENGSAVSCATALTVYQAAADPLNSAVADANVALASASSTQGYGASPGAKELIASVGSLLASATDGLGAPTCTSAADAVALRAAAPSVADQTAGLMSATDALNASLSAYTERSGNKPTATEMPTASTATKPATSTASTPTKPTQTTTTSKPPSQTLTPALSPAQTQKTTVTPPQASTGSVHPETSRTTATGVQSPTATSPQVSTSSSPQVTRTTITPVQPSQTSTPPVQTTKPTTSSPASTPATTAATTPATTAATTPATTVTFMPSTSATQTTPTGPTKPYVVSTTIDYAVWGAAERVSATVADPDNCGYGLVVGFINSVAGSAVFTDQVGANTLSGPWMTTVPALKPYALIFPHC